MKTTMQCLRGSMQEAMCMLKRNKPINALKEGQLGPIDTVFKVAQACAKARNRAAAIVLPVDVGKSRLRTRSVSEFPETSWLCSFGGTAPLSRSPGADTNPGAAQKQPTAHSAWRSAHQHAPIRKQEAQQGGFIDILLFLCP